MLLKMACNPLNEPLTSRLVIFQVVGNSLQDLILSRFGGGIHSLKLTAKAPENGWVFPKIMVPQNGWLKMENPIKMDDLGVPLFLETPRWLEYDRFLLGPGLFSGANCC